MEDNLITSDDTVVFCSLCHRPIASIKGEEFIGSVIRSVCFGRSCISSDEIQHAMDEVFQILKSRFDPT